MHNILVVDDEPLIAKLLKSFLEKNGFRVIAAFGGEEAISALRSQTTIDLIILDMKMPHVTGIDVIKKMEEMGCAIPLIILSGSLDAFRHLGNFTKCDEDDIMYKPLDLFVLLEKVKKKLMIKDE